MKSITTGWHDQEKTLIRYTFHGKWSSADLLEAFEHTQQLLEGLDHQVHFIIDLTHSNGLPQSILDLAMKVTPMSYSNAGLAFIINPTSLMTMFLHMIDKTTFRIWEKLIIIKSIDEVSAFVQYTPIDSAATASSG